MSDVARIREVIEAWALARDTGDWERLLSAFHLDGQVVTTWFEGPAPDFVERSRLAFENGALVHHILGGCQIDVVGHRAVAQTRMILCARACIDGVECDVACTGRFYDFFEKRKERWAIVLRQPIYEKDRLDPVDPSVRLTLDPEVLERYPVGYRHLAYLQTKNGQTVSRSQPGLRGPEVEGLYAKGRAWLSGAWDASSAKATLAC